MSKSGVRPINNSDEGGGGGAPVRPTFGDKAGDAAIGGAKVVGAIGVGVGAILLLPKLITKTMGDTLFAWLPENLRQPAAVVCCACCSCCIMLLPFLFIISKFM